MYDRELKTGRRFLDAHPPPGRVVFCALSGAHMYGFPSPDSDLDLKGAYLAPTVRLLGLRPETAAHNLTAVQEGTECDLTALELAKSLRLLLGGNGNTLEQIFSPHQLVPTPELDELRRLARGVLTTQFARHYRGFLQGLRREFEREETPEVKTLLYGFRVAGTGVRLLRKEEVEANLLRLVEVHDLADLKSLIERKAGAEEHTRLTVEEKELLRPAWDQLEERLNEAVAATSLPDEPASPEALDAWLIELRRR